MTKYLTKHEADLISEETFICEDCNWQEEHYEDLYQLPAGQGAVCPSCRSDNVKVWTEFTVYKIVRAKDSLHAIELALDSGELDAMDAYIRLGDRIDA